MYVKKKIMEKVSKKADEDYIVRSIRVKGIFFHINERKAAHRQDSDHVYCLPKEYFKRRIPKIGDRVRVFRNYNGNITALKINNYLVYKNY